jgi:hypothetical protein
MTEIDSTLDPFVEAEIKEHNAVLMRNIVAVEVITCVLVMLMGLASIIH